MIRLARFLRRLRTILTYGSGEGGYRFPVAEPGQCQSFVVEPDGHEHWVVNRASDDWTQPFCGRQHQFGAHPLVSPERLAQ